MSGQETNFICLACGRTPERSKTCGSLKLNISAKRTFDSAKSARPEQKQKSHSRLRNPVNIAATNPHLFEVPRLKHCRALNTCSSGHCPASSPHTAPSPALGFFMQQKQHKVSKATRGEVYSNVLFPIFSIVKRSNCQRKIF